MANRIEQRRLSRGVVHVVHRGEPVGKGEFKGVEVPSLDDHFEIPKGFGGRHVRELVDHSEEQLWRGWPGRHVHGQCHSNEPWR